MSGSYGFLSAETAAALIQIRSKLPHAALGAAEGWLGKGIYKSPF